MLMRIITSVIAFPALAAIIVIGGLPLKVLLLALSILGMYEVYRAFDKLNILNYISYAAILIYYLFVDITGSSTLPVLLFIYTICNLVFMVLNYEKINPIDVTVNIFGFLYVGLMMSAIYLCRNHLYGQYFVWLIFISAWGSDTFAYFTGITIGKHKLIPKLSPNKTIEGSIGGVAGAMLLALIYGLFIENMFLSKEVNLISLFILVGGAGAVLSQIGDLTASTIKRYTKIKDYGNIIPGHGGIIDRFDSVLFTAPITYIVMYYLISA